MDFTKVVLYTAADGRAKWREEKIALGEGNPQAMLSKVLAASGYQLRHSPIGFRSQWHCTPQPQWVFILAGEMEIGLQDGKHAPLPAGRALLLRGYAAAGGDLRPRLHGHWSAQRGPRALETLFLKA